MKTNQFEVAAAYMAVVYRAFLGARRPLMRGEVLRLSEVNALRADYALKRLVDVGILSRREAEPVEQRATRLESTRGSRYLYEIEEVLKPIEVEERMRELAFAAIGGLPGRRWSAHPLSIAWTGVIEALNMAVPA